MKITLSLVVVALVCYIAWPYVTVQRLDTALQSTEQGRLEHFLDVTQIRHHISLQLDRDVSTALGDDNNSVLGWLKRQVNDLGNRAIEEVIDTSWVRQQLLEKGPFKAQISYAFFESWDEFVIRLGRLGEDPRHVRLSLSAWRWRVSAIYD